MKATALISIILLSASAFANEAGEAHQAGVPTVVYWQVVNVVILFSALIYLTKDKVKGIFTDRRKTFVEAAEKSKRAQQEAEKQFLEIKHKLDLLESSTQESIARAQVEAAELKKSLIQDAQTAAAKVKSDSKESAQLEAQRAFRQLKNKTIEESLNLAKQVLTRDIGTQDHQKLQHDFAKNLAGASL